MIISLIAAIDEGGGIGRQGEVPWHLRTDLQRFKKLTLGHHIIMGRKTWDSIRRPLPGRTSLVVTRQVDYRLEGVIVLHSLDEALAVAQAAGETEAFVIGGGELYAQALPRAGCLYLTRVHTRLDCDTFFPPFEMGEWVEKERQFIPADEQNEYDSTYCVLMRENKAGA